MKNKNVSLRLYAIKKTDDTGGKGSIIKEVVANRQKGV